jgi:octaprenyl-diphosphate synthase
MSSLLAQSDNEIRDRLVSELAEVERRFAAELDSDLTCVNDLVRHVEQFRGKMLRPTLSLLTAMAVEPNRERTRDAQRALATVVEMVHMATLVHDDVLDEASMRRRGATINRLQGNEAAVMLGDYLISHSYHLCSAIGDPELSRAIAEATNSVCEGELLQLHHRHDGQLDERTYFEIIRRKTAGFCGRCCELSAYLAGTDRATSDALYEYGEKLGLAFQIVDDLLDLTGDSGVVGKTLGLDLAKGKLTLPLIRYMQQAAPAERERLQTLIAELEAGAADRQPELDQLCRLLADSESVTYARGRAERLVNQAKAALTGALAESPARAMLLSMADAVIARDY